MTELNSFDSPSLSAGSEAPPSGTPPSAKSGRTHRAAKSSRSLRNKKDYEKRKKNETAVHLWMSNETAAKLNAFQKRSTELRGDKISRGDLLAAVIDELDEDRQIALFNHCENSGLDMGVALASVVARGIDQLISEDRRQSANAPPGDRLPENQLDLDEARNTPPQDSAEHYNHAPDCLPSIEAETMEPGISPEEIGDDFLAFVNGGSPPPSLNERQPKSP